MKKQRLLLNKCNFLENQEEPEEILFAGISSLLEPFQGVSNVFCKSESWDIQVQELCLSEYQWKTGIVLDQMNSTKKQQSLIYETENLLALL